MIKAFPVQGTFHSSEPLKSSGPFQKWLGLSGGIHWASGIEPLRKFNHIYSLEQYEGNIIISLV